MNEADKVDQEVKHPNHYSKGNIEALEMLTQSFGLPYVIGQVCKYCLRAGLKDDILKDLKKAEFYIKWAIEVVTAERHKRRPCKPNDLFRNEELEATKLGLKLVYNRLCATPSDDPNQKKFLENMAKGFPFLSE